MEWRGPVPRAGGVPLGCAYITGLLKSPGQFCGVRTAIGSLLGTRALRLGRCAAHVPQQGTELGLEQGPPGLGALPLAPTPPHPLDGECTRVGAWKDGAPPRAWGGERRCPEAESRGPSLWGAIRCVCSGCRRRWPCPGAVAQGPFPQPHQHKAPGMLFSSWTCIPPAHFCFPRLGCLPNAPQTLLACAGGRILVLRGDTRGWCPALVCSLLCQWLCVLGKGVALSESPVPLCKGPSSQDSPFGTWFIGKV